MQLQAHFGFILSYDYSIYSVENPKRNFTDKTMFLCTIVVIPNLSQSKLT